MKNNIIIAGHTCWDVSAEFGFTKIFRFNLRKYLHRKQIRFVGKKGKKHPNNFAQIIMIKTIEKINE